MAKVGRNALTAQEAANMKSFSDWNYEEFSFFAAEEGQSDASSYISDSNPAKKVVLYQVPTADGTGSLAAANRLTIKINGENDANKKIILDIGDLPYTLSGFMITALNITIASPASGDGLSVLSFH